MRVGPKTSPPREVFLWPTEATNTTNDSIVPIELLPKGAVRFLDQTLVPTKERWVETEDYRVIAEAIRRLQVRGAPLIGIAGAYGLALAAAAGEDIEAAAAELRSTRPTAVNLSWALDRCLRSVDGLADADPIRERLRS